MINDGYPAPKQGTILQLILKNVGHDASVNVEQFGLISVLGFGVDHNSSTLSQRAVQS